jgi:hypothetical protein
LYIGDGYKNQNGFGFSNSDPKVISFIVSWLKDFFKFDTNKIKGHIWIHDNLNIEIARNFWVKTTKIPEQNLYKTYVAKNKPGSKKIRKNLHKYGIFTVILPSVKIQREILGLMARVLE